VRDTASGGICVETHKWRAESCLSVREAYKHKARAVNGDRRLSDVGADLAAYNRQRIHGFFRWQTTPRLAAMYAKQY
jgi:hypothetical protein